MNVTPTERKLQEIVAARLQIDPDRVEMDQPMIEEMGLDSFNVLSLMQDVEEAFPTVSFGDVSFEEMRTVRDVATFVDQARQRT